MTLTPSSDLEGHNISIEMVRIGRSQKFCYRQLLPCFVDLNSKPINQHIPNLKLDTKKPVAVFI